MRITNNKRTGRPTIYDPEKMLPKVLSLFREGASIKEVSAELGINRDTFYEWARKHTAFSDTIKRGEELSEAWWLSVGRKGVIGEVKINPTLWYMNMKNRFGWSDKHEEKSDSSIDMTNLSQTEKALLLEEAIKVLQKHREE